MKPGSSQSSTMYRPLAVEAEEAMTYLAWLLRSGNRAMLRDARPVVFDFLTVRWHFDPSTRDLVVQGDHAAAALRVHCLPETLMRVLQEPGFVPAKRDLSLFGDADALTPLVDSLKKTHNMLALRASTSKKSGD